MDLNSFNVELLNKMHFEEFTYNEDSNYLKHINSLDKTNKSVIV